MAKKTVKKLKNSTKSQRSLYLENDLWERIESRAIQDGRSLNNFLENYLGKSFVAQ